MEQPEALWSVGCVPEVHSVCFIQPDEDPSGSTPHWDIPRYPKISQDIPRYPNIRICSGYIQDIYMWISIYLSLDLLPFIQLDFLSGFGWSGWLMRAAAVLHLCKQVEATTGRWLIEARQRCGRAGRSQTTERDDSWAIMMEWCVMLCPENEASA